MLHPLLTSLAAVLVSHVVVLSAVLALVAAADPAEVTADPRPGGAHSAPSLPGCRS